ncbi:glyoxalase [Ancylobacter sp. 6x-1]|uniref:Glyoxalase n=1 Tax=Ancylobacter crimeensis TaxID=2579147 RepID=A0ABT0D9N1_9HYPH|nr:VOC family protein [Ancylobacter crimeensis]MCK0196661.1 glyoxalase [Ancylobacter crimeensis]
MPDIMPTKVNQIFVNLPVRDLPASMAFFRALGFDFNPQFTDANAACLVLGENFYAMLLVEDFFSGFSKLPVPDNAAGKEVLVALSVDSRAVVEDLVARAIAAGGTAPRPAQDHGFMYGHGFEDMDGHVWEFFHMSVMPDQR